jgi:hypothetical protein
MDTLQLAAFALFGFVDRFCDECFEHLQSQQVDVSVLRMNLASF